jgi:hypothetical protein
MTARQSGRFAFTLVPPSAGAAVDETGAGGGGGGFPAQPAASATAVTNVSLRKSTLPHRYPTPNTRARCRTGSRAGGFTPTTRTPNGRAPAIFPQGCSVSTTPRP